MKALVTKAFPGRPDGEPLPRTINVGETIIGDLAAVAVREEWAEEIGAVPAPDTDPLAGMTIAQLKAYAEEQSIDVGDATKKADIIAAIQLAEEGK